MLPPRDLSVRTQTATLRNGRTATRTETGAETAITVAIATEIETMTDAARIVVT